MLEIYNHGEDYYQYDFCIEKIYVICVNLSSSAADEGGITISCTNNRRYKCLKRKTQKSF